MKKIFMLTFILSFLLFGCNNQDSYKIDNNIEDVTLLKINNSEYLKDIVLYDEKEKDNDGVYFDLEDSSKYNDYDLSNTSVTLLKTNEKKLFKDIIKKDKPTLILKVSTYCEYCKYLDSKEIYNMIKDSDYNLFFWCEDIGREDQLKYLEKLGIDTKYAINLNLNEDMYDLNDLGFPTSIFLNYNNKIKIVFQTIKPSNVFAQNLLKKLTKENY